MNKELYEELVYIEWCNRVEMEFLYTESRERYKKFCEAADYHCGDCTKAPASCCRCTIHECEIAAQKMYDRIQNILNKQEVQ